MGRDCTAESDRYTLLGAAENWTLFASKVDSKTFKRKGE